MGLRQLLSSQTSLAVVIEVVVLLVVSVHGNESKGSLNKINPLKRPNPSPIIIHHGRCNRTPPPSRLALPPHPDATNDEEEGLPRARRFLCSANLPLLVTQTQAYPTMSPPPPSPPPPPPPPLIRSKTETTSCPSPLPTQLSPSLTQIPPSSTSGLHRTPTHKVKSCFFDRHNHHHHHHVIHHRRVLRHHQVAHPAAGAVPSIGLGLVRACAMGVVALAAAVTGFVSLLLVRVWMLAVAFRTALHRRQCEHSLLWFLGVWLYLWERKHPCLPRKVLPLTDGAISEVCFVPRVHPRGGHARSHHMHRPICIAASTRQPSRCHTYPKEPLRQCPSV